jgi:uncharacterized protein involved in high-affinity Fe2+ transport
MKTNILIAALLMACVFSSCGDNKAEEKAQLNEVIKIHDKAMGNSEIAMKNKSRLDSLAKVTTNPAELTQIKGLSSYLDAADMAMEDWMHKFNVDNTGKSHKEIMDYLQQQKVQVTRIDSILTSANTMVEKHLKNVK